MFLIRFVAEMYLRIMRYTNLQRFPRPTSAEGQTTSLLTLFTQNILINSPNI